MCICMYRYKVEIGYAILVNMVDIKCLAILTYLLFVDSKYLETKTKIGTIYGLLEDVEVFGKNFPVSKYLGIPYAEPPIGDLRFMKPVPKAKLNEPLYALDHRDACLQFNVGLQPKGNISYSEDCLYLNIYAPVIKAENSEKLAVMIWIHGGGFVVGSADGYLGDHLAAYGRVIVVTLNYRLSLWGFFSSGDDLVPGNNGLWDQHMAIKWVHENIEAFGGDSKRITLFGESSGAGSVMLQGLYSGNKDFLHRMIAQSGSVGSWWSTDTVHKRKESTSKLVKLAGCEVTPTKNMIKCLQSIPGKQLLNIIENHENGFKALPVPFIPMVDNDFIKVSKENIFRPGNSLQKEDGDFFLSLDLMMGINNGDGSGAIGPLYGVKDPDNFLPNRTIFESSVSALIKRLYPGLEDSILRDAIIAEYTNWQNPFDSHLIREEIMAMHLDSTYTGPMHRALNFHSKSTKGNYMYYFDDFTSNHLFCKISWFKKMSHGAEIPLIFGYKNSDRLTDWQFYPTSLERQFSKRVMTLWSNFAKTGNPNLPDEDGLDWLKYTKMHQHYLQISRDMTSSNVKQRLNARRANFWAYFIPVLVKSANCEHTTNLETKTNTCQRDEPCPP